MGPCPDGMAITNGSRLSENCGKAVCLVTPNSRPGV